MAGAASNRSYRNARLHRVDTKPHNNPAAKTLNRRHPDPCRALSGKAKDPSSSLHLLLVAAAFWAGAFEFAFAFVATSFSF